MDENNRGGYNPQNVPETPNPYTNTPQINQQPQPNQTYGYQPYQPPVPNQVSAQNPLNKQPSDDSSKKIKTLIFGGIGVFLLLIIGLVLALVLTGAKNQDDGAIKLEKTYDSPAGMLDAFQSSDVTNGKFKLSSNYVTGEGFNRDGKFFVENGEVYFEVMPDTSKVNNYIRGLYVKQDKQAEYNEIDQGATKNLRYDFMTLLGYGYLNDKNLPNKFIPLVEQARDNPELEAKNKSLTLGRDCNAALVELRSKINSNLSTTNMDFDFSQQGVRTRALVAFSTRQSIDNSVIRFVENCFNMKRKEGDYYRLFKEELQKSVTKSPVFEFWQEGASSFLEIKEISETTAFGSDLKFEFTELNSLGESKSGDVGAYSERRNLYGLAYDICRTSPVVTTNIQAGYRFMSEDTKYDEPNVSHTGYYCDTRTTPSEFQPAKQVAIKLANGLTQDVTSDKLGNLAVISDLRYEVEKYYKQYNRYPNQSEFSELVDNNLSSLSGRAKGMIDAKSLQYKALPSLCVGDCKEYELTYNYAPNFTLQRFPY